MNYIILNIYFMLKITLCTCCEQYRVNVNSLKQFVLFSYNLFKNFAAEKLSSS